MIVLYKMFLLWWKKNPVRAFLSIGVCLSHLFLLNYLISSSQITEKKKSHPLVVRTLSPKVPTQTSTLVKEKKVTAPAKKTTPAPQAKKPEPPPKPPAAKTPTAKPIKKPEPPPQKTAPSKPTPKKDPVLAQKKQLIQESLKKIEKSIAEIEPKNDKMKSAPVLTVPPKVAIQSDFMEDAAFSQEEADYLTSLVGYLQNNLQLPDIGEVKIQITLSPEGKVKAIKVLSSKSEKNKNRLEEQLPNLHFPLPQGKKEKLDRTFILTFCNDL